MPKRSDIQSVLVLGSGPAPEEYDDLEAEQELDFGGY